MTNTLETYKTVLELFKSGYTPKEIAHIIESPTETVYSYLKRVGLDFKDEGKIKEKRLKRVQSFYNSFYTQEEMAEMLGVSVTTIATDCQQLNLSSEKLAEKRREKRLKAILDLDKRGLTLNQIHEVVQISKQTIYYVLKENAT